MTSARAGGLLAAVSAAVALASPVLAQRVPPGAIAPTAGTAAPPASAAPAGGGPDEPMPFAPDEPMPGEDLSSPSPGAPAPAAASQPSVPPAGASSQPAASVPAVAPRGASGAMPAEPHFLLSWRTFAAVLPGAPPAGPGQGPARERFNALSAEFYPVSYDTLRMGTATQLALGGADTAGGSGDVALAADVMLGLQWPARVSPYVDGIFGIGFLRRQLFNQDAFNLLYSVGLDAGLSVRVAGRLAVAASLGWMRPVYRAAVPVYTDTLTARVAIGF